MALLDFLDKRKKNDSEEMSFIDHLEELRWHLIRSVIAIVIAGIVFFIYVREIVNDILLAPPGGRADPRFCPGAGRQLVG